MTRRRVISWFSALLAGWLGTRAKPGAATPVASEAGSAAFAGFLRAYPRDSSVRPCTEEQCAAWRGKLPDALIRFWREVGRGSFGGGIITLVDPRQWHAELDGWLLGQTEGRAVIARSAFGDLFYYRDLGMQLIGGAQAHAEDISRLDPHGSAGTVEVCAWGIEEFFESYLCTAESADAALRKRLYTAAVRRLGQAIGDQGFYFVPALRLGGNERAESIDKGDLHVQLDILLQLAQAQ